MTTTLPYATAQDGTHPSPRLMRRAWVDLSGPWSFAFDDADTGLADGWATGDGAPLDREITVPFPPESSASGIGDTGPHRIFWYRRELTDADLAATGRGEGDRVVLHLGAVDHEADVWVGGAHVAHHVGGQTPFEADVTDALAAAGPGAAVVVRAVDEPRDIEQPRGKQDWQDTPHAIWYERTSGIWQPVWLEARPAFALARIDATTDLARGAAAFALETTTRPPAGATATITVSFRGEEQAATTASLVEPTTLVTLQLPVMTNDQVHDHRLWTPENPALFDVEVSLSPSDDVVASYFGMRTVGTDAGRLLLNKRPRRIRAVLEQGYWPESHLAAPSVEAIRAEVALIKELGFDTARIHQKAEDPRFLFQADVQGLMLWGETANADTFTPHAVELLAKEWIDLVRRDRSHPSIVAWVPLNESWGVQQITLDARQDHYARALYHLAKALDGTRPVITNDGWEHSGSDLMTVHDYDQTGEGLAARWASGPDGLPATHGYAPSGRRFRVDDTEVGGEPVIISEMGGIDFASTHGEGSWGYSSVTDAGAFESRLREQISALIASPGVTGFCYTQLTDTLQETNGLATPDRRPKIDAAVIRGIMTGEG